MRPEYRALLWKREPSFSVAVPDSEAVPPTDAGSFVSGSEIFPMKKADSEFDLDAECNFQVLSDEATETAGKYEYMRESQALRHEIENFGTGNTNLSTIRSNYRFATTACASFTVALMTL